MGLGRLCHFFLEIAKSKSPRQGIFIYVLYDYWGQCLSEFSYVVSSSLIWIGVPFLTGVTPQPTFFYDGGVEAVSAHDHPSMKLT